MSFGMVGFLVWAVGGGGGGRGGRGVGCKSINNHCGYMCKSRSMILRVRIYMYVFFVYSSIPSGQTPCSALLAGSLIPAVGWDPAHPTRHHESRNDPHAKFPHHHASNY
jgi:hypothetical protein